jgi:hypothetical protein
MAVYQMDFHSLSHLIYSEEYRRSFSWNLDGHVSNHYYKKKIRIVKPRI